LKRNRGDNFFYKKSIEREKKWGGKNELFERIEIRRKEVEKSLSVYLDK